MTTCVINDLLYDKITQENNEFFTIYSVVFNCGLTALTQLCSQWLTRVISSYIYSLKIHICTRYLARCVIILHILLHILLVLLLVLLYTLYYRQSYSLVLWEQVLLLYTSTTTVHTSYIVDIMGYVILFLV